MEPNNVLITGIGIVSVRGADAVSVWKRLNEKKDFKGDSGRKFDGEIDFTIDFPASKLRRVNRYSRLALAGAIEAQKDAAVVSDEASAFRRGAVFTTGYGSIVSNVGFAESVVKGDPDLCSPSVFSGTVPNAGAGQVCMQLNLKGPGTVLMGGNVFVYSKLLLETGKADVIFAGAVEEYSSELRDSFGKNEIASGLNISEAAVVLTLAPDRCSPAGGTAYCALGSGASASLRGFPPVKKLDPGPAVQAMKSALSRCADRADVVFSSAGGSYFDDIEARAIAEALPRSAVVSGVKDFFGETLGCAFCLNAAAAALCIKNKAIPRSLSGSGLYDSGFSNILVTGFDPAGNYNCLVLKEC